MVKSNNILLTKIEDFIRKYYKNQLLKGSILAFSLVVIAFFSLSFAEYFGRFGTATRTGLFYLFIAACVGVLFWYIFRPLMGLFNVNRKFDINQASQLIGNHFPDVKDKLLNTLQLQKESTSQKDNTLLLASIEQKTQQLKPIPFANAINFGTNKKYIKIALLPAIALGLILFVSPGFKNSSERIVNFSYHFEIQAPFSFITNLDKVNAIQNQDIEIPLTIEGNEIPDEAYVHIGDNRYKMKTNDVGEFFFTLKNIQKSEEVYFEAAGFTSTLYTLDIALKPSILGYKAYLNFPKYLRRVPETSTNLSEISIPQGSTIKWQFTTKNVEQLHYNNESLSLKKASASFTKRFMKSGLIKVRTANSDVSSGDSITYQINVIPDQFAGINVNQQKDSLSSKIMYFLGEINDDYGFSKLDFHYSFKSTTNEVNKGKKGTLAVPIDKTLTEQKFYHYWNLAALNITAEDEIEYYFTVWDNDGVNGSKPTKSTISVYKAPSLKEIEEKTEQANKEIKNELASSQAQAEQLQEDLSAVEKMLTEKKNLDWNDKKKIQDLLDKQKKLQDQLKNTIDKNLQKNLQEEEFKKMDQDLLDKQKQLEKLLNEVLDDETKALMEKIQKLLEQNNKNELQKQLDNFKFNEKEMNKKMDRLLELFKELELEKKMNETVDKLDKLAEEQKELSEKTKDQKGKNEDLEKQQDKLNEKFEDIKKDLEDIHKKNDELESPKDISKQEDSQKKVDEKQDQSKEDLSKGKNKPASESQDDASEEMQKMSDQMWAEMQEEEEEQSMEDLNTLRQILENLITLSFDQEKVIEGFKVNKSYNDNYIELRQRQRKIKDETKIVEDSLFALSKRNPQMEHFVNEEIARVNDNLEKSLVHLGERYTNRALVNQQNAMTGYNNLALMLSEIMKQMQEQMKASAQNKGKPKKACKNPGNKPGGKPGKPSAKAIKKMQQQLAKQLEDMQKGMKPGQGMPGSKEFAQMAAQQAAIRKKLQDLQRQLQKEGKGGSLGNIKETQDLMDDIEEDMYNKRLNNSTMQKIKKLEIKLSQHEKAEKEQEQDDKRSSNEGKNPERRIPPSIKKYLDQKNKETELLRKVSPELQPYYKKKVEEYFGKG